MTTVVEDLLMECVRLGITLESHGDKLRCSPRASMTDDLAGRLKHNKVALLAILTDGSKQTGTHGLREARRFLRVCRPYPDGRGAYDPRYEATVRMLVGVPCPQDREEEPP